VRENTYLRGALLGYTKKFMDEKYDEIIEFAELEDFQEYSFKQLSSGMKSRLAFSIACLVNPDILILDEVLSVGDGSFREKSGNRMKEILDTGVTGILVSHSLSQVRELCNKVLWLDRGNQIAFGETEDICNAYQHFLYQKKKERQLPESMEEIHEISRKYKLFVRLAEQERRSGENEEMLATETAAQCERRWWKTIEAMPQDQLEELYKYYVDVDDNGMTLYERHRFYDD
jgi:ABC-2 type transport system ATP-binding protein